MPSDEFLERDLPDELPTVSETAAYPEIPGYQLVRVIGRGGMGIVYEAIQAYTEQRVALKVLNRANREARRLEERFRNEVKLTSTLVHPNIVRLYHPGVHQDQFYFVMELVEGESLDQFVAGERLDTLRALQLFRRVCQAVLVAHEKKIIHRDLKPSNILVTKDGEPHILDFGVAKVIQELPGYGEHTFAGTLKYMAPEQKSGGPVSLKTDVYPLGVMLCRLLTGRYPYDLQQTHADLCRGIACTPNALADESGHIVGDEIAGIITGAVANDVNDRHSLNELIGAIRNCSGRLSEQQAQPSELPSPLRSSRAVLTVIVIGIHRMHELRMEIGEIEFETKRSELESLIRHEISRIEGANLIQTTRDEFLGTFVEPNKAVIVSLNIIREVTMQFGLQVRIGIDMGPVHLRKSGVSLINVSGRHADRAALLKSRAEPGCILTTFQVCDCSIGWLDKSIEWKQRGELKHDDSAPTAMLYEPVDSTMPRRQQRVTVDTTKHHLELEGTVCYMAKMADEFEDSLSWPAPPKVKSVDASDIQKIESQLDEVKPLRDFASLMLILEHGSVNKASEVAEVTLSPELVGYPLFSRMDRLIYKPITVNDQFLEKQGADWVLTPFAVRRCEGLWEALPLVYKPLIHRQLDQICRLSFNDISSEQKPTQFMSRPPLWRPTGRWRGDYEEYWNLRKAWSLPWEIIRHSASSQADGRVRVLWVDDCPDNNSLEIGMLIDSGVVKVDQARDRVGAIGCLTNGDVSMVISDMSREESRIAGLRLLDDIRKAGLSIPVVIYTSPENVGRLGHRAENLGAVLCTAGMISLFAAIEVCLVMSSLKEDYPEQRSQLPAMRSMIAGRALELAGQEVPGVDS